MSSPPLPIDEEEFRPDPWDDTDWKQLIEDIEHRNVIPVIGPELLTVEVGGETVPLYKHLAQLLGAELLATEDVPRIPRFHLPTGGTRGATESIDVADETTNANAPQPKVSRGPREAKLDSQNPWPSLKAFTESAEPFFCGRDAEIDDLFRRVRRRPLTVLYGVSGPGKTSLLQAGLFPQLPPSC